MSTLAEAKDLFAEGMLVEAFKIAVESYGTDVDYSTLSGFARLLDRMPKEGLNLRPIRVAVAGTSTTDHLIPVLRLLLAREGFDADIYNAEFGTLDQTILDPGSEMYLFNPEILWLFTSFRDVLFDLTPGDTSEQVELAIEDAVDVARARWQIIRERTDTYIIQNNADLPVARPHGNLDGNARWGRVGFLRRYNTALADAAGPGVTIMDIDHLSAIYGKAAWFDDRFWHYSKHAFSLKAIGMVSHHAAKLVAATKGKVKKCLVVDLDNTLWGGVIGDDGPSGIKIGAGTVEGEAFAEFQDYLLALKRRGVILAVCSKNDPEIAAAAFNEAPGMRLKLEDFAAFVANWTNKADNIAGIAETLEIGLDSMVFIDDNPVERDLVRTMLPMVAVPEVPEDPSQFVRTLDKECYAELVAFTAEDSRRTDLYRANASRKKSQSQFSNLDEFLRQLDMVATVGRFDEDHLPRIAQLINKSNQFHLTTTRYTEAQVQTMMSEERKICRYFRLADRHGDNGLISVTILEETNTDELTIDTWVMSCRVLARGMEEFICNAMIADCRALNRKRLIGRYVPTPKNNLVSALYDQLGFTLLDDENGTTTWQLTVRDDTKPLPTVIRSATEIDPTVRQANPTKQIDAESVGQLE